MEKRQSYNRLLSTMGFPILVRLHLYFELEPRPQTSTALMTKLDMIFFKASVAHNYISHIWRIKGYNGSMAKPPYEWSEHNKSKGTGWIVLKFGTQMFHFWNWEFWQSLLCVSIAFSTTAMNVITKNELGGLFLNLEHILVAVVP